MSNFRSQSFALRASTCSSGDADNSGDKPQWTNRCPEASTIQEEVDSHPTATAAQLDDLKERESSGDSYASWGNLLFLSGVAVGAVSTYLFLRDRKRSAALQSARIAPAVFDHGGGITLTIGGLP